MTAMTSKISISPAFGLYFLYCLWVWLCDGVDLVCYLAGIAQCTAASRVLVTAVLAGGVYALRGQLRLERRQKPDKLFVLCALLLTAAGAYKAILPDVSWDVFNYHLLVQAPGYSDTVTESFIPGNFQMFGFRWPDRLFYAFREGLGYRMGTLLNTGVTLLLCAQMRRLMGALWGERLADCRSHLPKGTKWLLSESLLAFLTVLAWDCINQQATYFVDLLALPIAMEALHILLVDHDKPRSAGQMVWFAFLNGCFFAFKMTNVVFVAPMILMYLFLHRKDLTVGRFFGALVLALVPVSIYLVYAWAETGNPIYPYFNGVFESPYFGGYDFKDTRWGPQKLRDFILWPFIAIFFPTYYGCEVPNAYPYGMILMVGAVGLLVLGMLLCKKWRSVPSVLLVVLLITSAYAWTFTTGYIRYYVWGEMLVGLIAVDFLSRLLENGGWKRWIAVVPMAVLLVQPFYYEYKIINSWEISWRDSSNLDAIVRNVRDVFRDQDTALEWTEEMPEPDMILLNNDFCGGLAAMLCPDTPIVHQLFMDGSIGQLGWNEESEQVVADWHETIADTLENGLVYDLAMAGFDKTTDIATRVEKLQAKGLCCETVYWPETVFDSYDGVQIWVIKAREEGCQHGVYYADNAEHQLAAENRLVQLEARALMELGWVDYAYTSFALSVVASDGDREEVVYTTTLNQRETIDLSATLDLTGFGENVTLHFTCARTDGEAMPDWWRCAVLNPVVEG